MWSQASSLEKSVISQNKVILIFLVLRSYIVLDAWKKMTPCYKMARHTWAHLVSVFLCFMEIRVSVLYNSKTYFELQIKWRGLEDILLSNRMKEENRVFPQALHFFQKENNNLLCNIQEFLQNKFLS